jgi:hypothetical protein
VDIFPAVKVRKRTDGRLALDVSDRYPDLWIEAMKRWAKKGYVQVILKAPESPATIEQNSFWHALLAVWWKSRVHSFNTYDEMRDAMKYRYGVVKRIAFTPDGTWRELTSRDELRPGESEAPYLVSWSKYKKAQRSRVIEGTIAEMEQNGILDCESTNEYLEIINGVRDAA